MLNLQSNAIRGDFMRSIMDTTIQEIHDDIVTVFGPYARDAYITKNQQPYFTRDGKEVLSSLRFDNELAMYVLKIIYQAVHRQGTKVGDGTTTLAVLYTNLYKVLRNSDIDFTRNDWNRMMEYINERINRKAVPLSDDMMINMLFTCTQDSELAAKIYKNLREPIMNHAYITVDKSNIDTDFEMTVHNAPLIKVTKQFSVRPINDVEPDCTILHCNGMLDISHVEVMLDMMSRVPYSEENGTTKYYPKTVILLCNGITEATRRTTKELIATLKKINIDTTQYNNLAIYTLTEYRSYSSEQIEDISTIITDENGIGGLVNQLTFESLLHQSLGNPENRIEELCTFDCDLRHINKMIDIFNQSYQIEFDEIEGMKLSKPLGPVAKARYEELKKTIAEEKSEVAKIGLNRRLKTMYGQFIAVEVGSKLIKDSQRKYELILDAVLSSSEAVEKGVLTANSLLIALSVVDEVINNQFFAENINPENSVEYNKAIHMLNILHRALYYTVADMVMNRDPSLSEMQSPLSFKYWYEDTDLSKFNLHASNVDDILPKKSTGIEHKNYTVTVDDKEYQYTNQIVEPVSIITTMLEHSTTMFELATAKTIHLDNMIGNYLEIKEM